MPNPVRAEDAATRTDFSPAARARAVRGETGADDGGLETTGPGGASGELSEEEQREVRELQRRDAEVRRHEQAHIAAGGQYVRGGANFEYTVGPDGRRYATGGEVSIDVSAERTPEATIAKMQVVRRAALAPAQPSAQDRQVAAQAARTASQARAELARQRMEEVRDGAPPVLEAIAPPAAAVTERPDAPSGAVVPQSNANAVRARGALAPVAPDAAQGSASPPPVPGAGGNRANPVPPTARGIIQGVIGGAAGGVATLDYRV